MKYVIDKEDKTITVFDNAPLVNDKLLDHYKNKGYIAIFEPSYDYGQPDIKFTRATGEIYTINAKNAWSGQDFDLCRMDDDIFQLKSRIVTLEDRLEQLEEEIKLCVTQ